MILKINSCNVFQAMEDVKRIVSENSDACKKAKDTISDATFIFPHKINHPKNQFHMVR